VLQLVVRRLLLLIPTLLLVTFGVFSLVALVPGDAATYIAGGANAEPAKIAEVRHELGFDDPYMVQYGRWLKKAARLDFGKSVISGSDVTGEIRRDLPVTVSIVFGAMFFALLFGIPIGLWSGARQGGLIDRALLLLTSASVSIPNFVLAIVFINYFAIQLGWFEAVGFVRLTSPHGLQIFDWLKSLTLPALSLGIGIGARFARQLRAGVVDTMNEPYIRAAWAKGCSPRRVIGKHVFKNAALPTLTIAGITMGAMLGGTVIVEQIFSVPGVGAYLVQAITNRDLPAIQGIVVMFVLSFAIINLLVDIVYGWLNPKIEVA
jgi:peptide/nickel transport system permease protein